MSSCLDPWTISQFFFQPEIPLECTVALGSVDDVTIYTIADYLQVFLCTLLLETPFYLGYLRWRKRSWGLSIALLLFCNLATHPAVTFLIPRITHSLGWTVATGAVLKEIFAPAVEAVILVRFGRLGRFEALALALIANLFSWWVGALF